MNWMGLKSAPLTAEVIAASDCVLIATAHQAVDYQLILDRASLVVDTRNAIQRFLGVNGAASVVKA
jgi:UDP-N-acetyl-D-glucosamine dehydrogenase